MNAAVLDRLEYLLGQATPAPWHRANLANITTEIIHGRAWVRGQPTVIERRQYGPWDDTLCTEAVNALPALIAIARASLPEPPAE